MYFWQKSAVVLWGTVSWPTSISNLKWLEKACSKDENCMFSLQHCGPWDHWFSIFPMFLSFLSLHLKEQCHWGAAWYAMLWVEMCDSFQNGNISMVAETVKNTMLSRNLEVTPFWPSHLWRTHTGCGFANWLLGCRVMDDDLTLPWNLWPTSCWRKHCHSNAKNICW